MIWESALRLLKRAAARRLALFGILLAAQCAMSRPLAAQDDVVVEDVPAAVPEQQFMVADENFDQWVFGGRGAGEVKRNRFESMLKVQIAGIERSCPLTDDQKKKLALAGGADIMRFFERVELLRKKFQLVKNDQNKFNQFWQEIQPIQAQINKGTFGEGSYFRKTLNNLLSSGQLAQYDAADRERRIYNYRSKVEVVVCSLDDVLSLRSDQRDELIELLAKGTQVPRSFGQDSYAQYAVLYQASLLPEDKLKQILDPPQLQAVRQILNQARGYAQFLKANGYEWDFETGPGNRADQKAEVAVPDENLPEEKAGS